MALLRTTTKTHPGLCKVWSLRGDAARHVDWKRQQTFCLLCRPRGLHLTGIGEKTEAQSRTLLPLQRSLAGLTLRKARTSPRPNPIKGFEGWRLQSFSVAYRSPLQFSFQLSKQRDIVCEKIQDEEKVANHSCRSFTLIASPQKIHHSVT